MKDTTDKFISKLTTDKRNIVTKLIELASKFSNKSEESRGRGLTFWQ